MATHCYTNLPCSNFGPIFGLLREPSGSFASSAAHRRACIFCATIGKIPDGTLQAFLEGSMADSNRGRETFATDNDPKWAFFFSRRSNRQHA
jgi:hypothetical protein